jgi:uncharacterized protein (DUF1697 family)
MPRYVALLRGINVGGHRVKMTDLKRHFEALKFNRVETFIASGNVLFDTAETAAAKLERRIEAHLEAKLGYAVPTFLRTPGELAAIAAHRPFSPQDMEEPAYSSYVIFFGAPLSAAAIQQIESFRTRADEFAVHGREVYWLCRGKISIDSLAAPMMAKTPESAPSTMRNLNTVKTLAEMLVLEAEPVKQKPKTRAAR